MVAIWGNYQEKLLAKFGSRQVMGWHLRAIRIDSNAPAYAPESDAGKCHVASFDDYISKPIHFVRLREVMAKHLSSASVRTLKQSGTEALISGPRIQRPPAN